MEIRNAIHPEHAASFDTGHIREHFLIQNLFNPDEIKLVYSCFDRLIVGGVCPLNPLRLMDKPLKLCTFRSQHIRQGCWEQPFAS
ncbi:MAG: hypothetical protein JRF72_10050 [Deltaproteobacteria bacterium]|jgi:5-keto 4-deoxyuronate isomerase|nr:hypothetical protein [Deltaproteobacteria bacterium]